MSIIINNIKYIIIKELGKGGFGKVNQVLSELDNKYYAIKEIPIKEASQEQIKNSQNEIYILSKFNCNNIVKYYDSSIDENNIYILMEFCDGENLRNLINKNQENNTLIQENIIINIIKQICIGIKEIHNKKIIHRDLKPENIFLNKNMNIKIGDFGISKQLNFNATFAITKNRAGSDHYTAPEILTKGIYNEKSDIYSLGCIIYELLTLYNYYQDKLSDEIKTINSEFYNYKWKELINSTLQGNYNKRFDINKVIQFLADELKIIINNKENNIIIGEIYINENNINQDIQIINSLENLRRTQDLSFEDDDWKKENEKELKENVEIKINGKLIEFAYYYKFNKEGKYKIEYSFKNNLSKTCLMFWGCKFITSLDLSNFNAQNVTDMSFMFSCCDLLANINLSNINTQNVTDMSFMFSCCNTLTNLDLSNFNTQNVTNMSCMFDGCYSLTNLDFSNFNMQNVTDMSGMFDGCHSLINLKLPKLNDNNDINMNNIFSFCNSLKKENIKMISL